MVGEEEEGTGKVMSQIQLNGAAYPIDLPATVEDLLDRLQATGQRVAVMVNDDIIRKDRRASVNLSEGDAVEVIGMVGGG